MVEYCVNKMYLHEDRGCTLPNLYLVGDRIHVGGPMVVKLLSQVGWWLEFVSAADAGYCGTERCAHREELCPDT
jgi:hypothetical protein